MTIEQLDQYSFFDFTPEQQPFLICQFRSLEISPGSLTFYTGERFSPICKITIYRDDADITLTPVNNNIDLITIKCQDRFTYNFYGHKNFF